MVQFCGDNMAMGEFLVFEQEEASTMGRVVHPGIVGEAEVLQQAFVEAIRPCKVGEQGEEVIMRASAQKKFLESQLFRGLIDTTIGKMMMARITKAISGGEGSQIDTTKIEGLIVTITNNTGSAACRYRLSI